MKTIKAGVYYSYFGDKLIILSNVSVYKDATSLFAIVNWRDESGFHYKVMITGKQFKQLKRIGKL